MANPKEMPKELRSKLNVRISLTDKQKLAELSAALQLTISDEIRLGVSLLTYLLQHQPYVSLLLSKFGTHITYEIDAVGGDNHRQAGTHVIEVVTSPNLESDLQFLKTHKFGRTSSEIVRRATTVLSELSDYINDGWELWTLHGTSIQEGKLVPLQLSYPLTFSGDSAIDSTTSPEGVFDEYEDLVIEDNVKLADMVSHIVEHYRDSSLMKIARRWARLRSESVENLVKECVVLAQQSLAPEFFAGCESSEKVVAKLKDSHVPFRSIAVCIDKLSVFAKLSVGLTAQLTGDAKVFVFHRDQEIASQMCQSLVVCWKEMSCEQFPHSRLYAVGVADSFLDKSKLQYPQFIICDYNVPFLRQGIRANGHKDSPTWKPIPQKQLDNASKYVAYLIRRAERKAAESAVPDEFVTVEMGGA